VILVLVPVGRGNWKRMHMVIQSPAQLFPQIREQQVLPKERWFMAGRWWRIVEVMP
jgi:hypothetical protein